MWRSGGDVIIQLQAKIGGEGVVGWKYTVGRMKDCGMDYKTHPSYPTKTWVFNASWSKTESAGEYTKEYTFTRKADMIDNVRAASTKAALNAFVESYDQFFYDTLLEYEGEVFNPITMETRLHYHDSWNTPLEETWVRLTDNEQTLRNQCDDSFKALAGAILPVKAWDLHRSEKRPQNDVRAIIDHKDTKPFGLRSGVGLMPRCWEIITVDDPDHPGNAQHVRMAVKRALEISALHDDSPEQRAMKELKNGLAADRHLLADALEQISNLSEEALRLTTQIAEKEALYAKHSHLDKELVE